jgi:hypothetical protein
MTDAVANITVMGLRRRAARRMRATVLLVTGDLPTGATLIVFRERATDVDISSK